jgi:hypothetical protein
LSQTCFNTCSLDPDAGLPLYRNWPGMVAHTYNPSYSGGRDQEDRSSKPAQALNCHKKK